MDSEADVAVQEKVPASGDRVSKISFSGTFCSHSSDQCVNHQWIPDQSVMTKNKDFKGVNLGFRFKGL